MPTEKVITLTRKVLAALKAADGPRKNAKSHSPIKELLLGALSAEMARRSALIALNRVERAFVDWNEVRVSSVYEIAEAMNGVAENIEGAERIRAVLHRVFDVTNDMSLSVIEEKRFRDAARLVNRLAAPAKRTSRSSRNPRTRRKTPARKTSRRARSGSSSGAGSKERKRKQP